VTASLAQVYVGNCAADIKQPANVLLTSLCLTGHQNTFYTLPAPHLVNGQDLMSNPYPCHSNSDQICSLHALKCRNADVYVLYIGCWLLMPKIKIKRSLFMAYPVMFLGPQWDQ